MGTYPGLGKVEGLPWAGVSRQDAKTRSLVGARLSSAAISTPTPPVWWILLKIPAVKATEPREYHEQNPDEPGPLAKPTTLMLRSHTQIRSDDIPWQRSRVPVPRVRPSLRTVLTWINISVVDFAKNPVPQGETTSRIFF